MSRSFKFPSYAIRSLLATCLLLLSPTLSSAHDDLTHAKPPRMITLSATGSIDTKPDIASISTGIESVAVKARDALDDNNEVMESMMKSLKQAGLADRDIATTQFSVQPRYERLPRRKRGEIPLPQTPRIIGYTVANSLRITVRQLDDLGSILDRLVRLGSNRFSGIQFGLSKPNKALDAARRDAMRKAIDKARLYARAADVRLGSITSISEQAHHYAPRPMAFSGRKSRAASVPIAPGQHTTNVTVHVKWQLLD